MWNMFQVPSNKVLKPAWAHLSSGTKHASLDRVGLGSNKFNRSTFLIRADDANWPWNNSKVLWWNGKFYLCKNLNVLALCFKIHSKKEGMDLLWMQRDKCMKQKNTTTYTKARYPVNKINQSSKIQAELTSTYREREDHHSAESFNLILYIHFKFIISFC